MHIHFVCSGNIYRSRLAEAYLKSKEVPGLNVSSSGVEATLNTSGPVSWYTVRLLKNNGIIKYMFPHWTQTTAGSLSKPDLIIFMEPFHLEYSKKSFGFSASNFEVWNIPDVVCGGEDEPKTVDDEERRCVNLTEETFQKIREGVDDLVLRLKL